ncbi:hypothetical protein LCGC14_2156800 [marine sediment metagenome]|uniref:Uncharacterized protein n=1 Tax=marine sediment metagenome TaxID=412755 RepID=A0A0F9GQB1_9ZZZZ
MNEKYKEFIEIHKDCKGLITYPKFAINENGLYRLVMTCVHEEKTFSTEGGK